MPGLGPFHRTDAGLLPVRLEGLRFSELGEHVLQSLQNFQWKRSSKAMTTAKDFLFPLPLGDCYHVQPEMQPWLTAVLRGLNSMYGSGQTNNQVPTALQKRVAQTVMGFLQRCFLWQEVVPQISFEDLFRVKGVDYRGEEIKLARSFNWECIAAAFPDEVGTLAIKDFCTGGCLSYINDFECFLRPQDQQHLGRVPRTMVADVDWPEVCAGLVRTGICGILPKRSLYHVGSTPLLNGLFAVSKNEFKDGVELHRLIMNMVPLNQLCLPFKGAVDTLPTVAGLNAFYLEEGEVAMMASEDINCFYYLFKIPSSWQRYMGFSREVPSCLCPPEFQGEPCHLVARVLPMGFLNSVGLAQHIHRNVVGWALKKAGSAGGGERELRRDRPPTVSRDLFRVYLDNWDQIRKVDRFLAAEIEGKPSEEQQAMRSEYAAVQLPRHPGKSVEGALTAEVQGAVIDGNAGVAYAKPDKILKYMGLAWELVHRGRATQRELQVIAGGLVYICMFRRPLLCGLNAIWRHIETLKGDSAVARRAVPLEVKEEVMRFLALVPLAQMDFRLPMEPQVTASDASMSGGGLCATVGLTSYGLLAQAALTRGETEEPFELTEVLTVGLFDGIGALRVAAELLHLPVAGHISVECNAAANRVVEASFPGTRHVSSVEGVTAEEVQTWACTYTSVGVVLLGAGPPCQGVSGLNADRKGSQRDLRSALYKEIPRVRDLVHQFFPWAQVHLFVESVASIDSQDRALMSRDLGLIPYRVDAAGVSLARRPRLYWLTWELTPEEGLTPQPMDGLEWMAVKSVELTAVVDQKDFLQPGWSLPPGHRFPTFTTARPSPRPGRRPAGLQGCDAETRQRWEADLHRYPPYQYRPEYCAHHSSGAVRMATVVERETILGFPANYTEQCWPKASRHGSEFIDARMTLLGNSWSVPVVLLLLKQLFERLGICPRATVQELVNRCAPGQGVRLQTVLQRPPVRREATGVYPDSGLARRLSGLTSTKGEDLLLQASSETLLGHQRLRQTIPAKLWKWKEITGWQWRTSGDHINLLEMRAALTTIKWVLQKRKTWGCRMVHLTDSLVVLHALTRGRSSSVKLRRTIMRINSLLLASNLHPVWAYVHTSLNPADRPSRRIKCQKWRKLKSI